MPDRIKIIFVLLLILWIPVNSFSQEFKTVHDGIEYAEITREIDKVPVRMNLLRLDLTKVRIDVVHGMDAAIGVETVPSMAKRYGAIAAINAGFFRLDSSLYLGDPSGALMVNGTLLSESEHNRIALFINNKPDRSAVSIARVNVGESCFINKKLFFFSGINRQRKENEMIVYYPEFHRTTMTANDGLEIVVREGKITAIYDGKGSTVIPQDGFVISISGAKREEILPLIRLGKKIKMRSGLSFPIKDSYPNEESHLTSEAYSTAEDIVSGRPQLIKNGKIDITWEQEKLSKDFVETKHPRTAVAKLKDGKFLMVTVDGRSEASGGIALNDLAAFLLEQGATDAMNLDGGGSTTMFLDGKVVNKPSDKEGERRVGDAILVFPRKK